MRTFAATLLFFTACGNAPGVCDKRLVHALSVRVLDARTDAGVCDATVDVSDGTFQAALSATEGDPATCSYFGVGDRKGTYRIVVQHASFTTATLDDVVVNQNSNGCHVMPQQRTLTLQPK